MTAELRRYVKAEIDRRRRARLEPGELRELELAAERKRQREWKRARLARMTAEELAGLRERDRLRRRRERQAQKATAA